MATKKANPEEPVSITIKPMNEKTLILNIEGIVPYVQHKFSAKARNQMVETQKAGSQARSKKVREPKDFDAIYEGVQYRMADGSHGIPCSAFRNAMISACRTVGYKMTHAKLAVWADFDGIDVDDGTPLVKINGEPEKYVAPARNDNGSVDIRIRPMWREGWTAKLRLSFDADMLSPQDIVNLISRAGRQVGIGEGRPDSKKSAGLGWGLFKIVNQTEAK